MNKLAGLQPERVFQYFEEIAAIPHGSGNTDAISRYCVDFAKAHGLAVVRDSLGNVIIKKPATPGYESHPTVIMQAHMDMVCEKSPESTIDFEKDGLELTVEGDWIHANGTTLGADDGIGVAMSLAILAAEDMAHPALEVLLTVDEEIGLIGAAAVDGSQLDGRILINLDGGNDDVIMVSCAGGVRADVSLPVEREANDMDTVEITVKGLKGGHSGAQIDKGRLNANKVMGEFLATLSDCRIVRIDGGQKDNAIPVECSCVVAVGENIEGRGDAFVLTHRVESDPNLAVTVKRTKKAQCAFTEDSTRRVIGFLTDVPNGIVSMSEDIEGLVKTSLNLGILKTEENAVEFSFGMRSSVGEEKAALLSRVSQLAQAFGGTSDSSGDYPAWEYRCDSVLQQTMCNVYKELYGTLPQIVAIHAGLECGYFCEKLPGLDAVSVGPNEVDIHTCRERLSVSSVEKFYRFLCETLKAI